MFCSALLFTLPPALLAAAGAAASGTADPEANLIRSGFWTSWTDLGNILLTVVIGYSLLVGAIRLLGARATSKMNNSDWIIAVAVGGIFGTMMIPQAVPLMNGLAAIGLLILLQYTITSAMLRVRGLRNWILSPPRLLLRDGELDEEAMRAERVSLAEINRALRAAGLGSRSQAAAVVLEANARLSVIRKADAEDLSVLSDVARGDSEGS